MKPLKLQQIEAKAILGFVEDFVVGDLPDQIEIGIVPRYSKTE